MQWSIVVNGIFNQRNNTNTLIIALLRTFTEIQKMEWGGINSKILQFKYDFFYI